MLAGSPISIVSGAALLCIALAGCAALDGAVSSRVNTLNDSTNYARNQSILENIVRAGNYEPLNFVALAKVTDGGNATLNAGFPSYSFGQMLTAAQKTYTFGPNSGSTQISSNFDLGILDTTDFYTGMMTPIDEILLTLLNHQGVNRDLLFSTVLESVRVEDDEEHKTFEFRNDPSQDVEMSCPDFDYGGVHQPICTDVKSPMYSASECESPYGPATPKSRRPNSWCPYHKFQYWVWRGLRYGLSSETRGKPNPDYKPGSGGSKTLAEGHICFDAALAIDKGANSYLTKAETTDDLGVCNGKWLRDAKVPARQPSLVKFGASDPPDQGGDAGVGSLSFPFEYYDRGKLLDSRSIRITFRLRSTFAIFQFLGKLLLSNTLKEVTPDPEDHHALLHIIRGETNNCFVQVEYEGLFCVPSSDSEYTKQVFSILSELIALNVKPGSLPITPTVQVAP